MRFLILLIVFCASTTSAQSCEKPLLFYVGPFISSNFIPEYWSEFIKSVESKTNCKVQVKTTESYTQYLIELIEKQGDIYLAPDHYFSALKEIGFKAIISSPKKGHFYLISKLNINNDITLLKGQTIAIAGPYTKAHLFLINWLKKHNLLDKVDIKALPRHDDITLSVLSGEFATGGILNIMYERLPKFVTDKYFKIPFGSPGGAKILIHDTQNQALTKAITSSRSLIKLLSNWQPSDPNEEAELSNEFKAQFNNFKSTLPKQIKRRPYIH